jgi:4-hydroxy-tetrahydrodipicolinate synthase
LSATLSGVIAAVATPIADDGAPDLKRAIKLANFLLDNGCDGLNVLGTTGEATSFARDERMAVMDAYKSNGLPLWCCRRFTTKACPTTDWSPISTRW